MTLITVVLPVLNARRYLAASIESCLSQAQVDLELVVVDGGSTDGTLAVANEFAAADARVRLIHQPANSGRLPGALNLGFEAARGDWWTWTQADDYFYPEALRTLGTYLAEHPDVGLVYAGFDFIDEAGHLVRPAQLGPPDSLRFTNPVGHCFLYRRAAAVQAGAYDPAYWMAEDVHFWLRMYQVTRLAHLPQQHYAHRLHPGSLTMADYGRYFALRLGAKARREVLGISWREYQHLVADAYIEEAFAAHAAGDRSRARRCMTQGVARRPGWLRNRGVVSILAQSWLRPGARRQPPASSITNG